MTVTVPELVVLDGTPYADSHDLARTFGVDHTALMGILTMMRDHFPEDAVDAHFRDRQRTVDGQDLTSILLSEAAVRTLFTTMDRLCASIGTAH